MKRLRVGIVGMGFIGASHIDALRRIGCAEIVAVADANLELAKEKAQIFQVPNAYNSIDEMLQEPIDVIHDCTPNHLHLEVNRKAIEAGKHVFSEKPLARTSDEAAEMIELLKANPDVVAGVNFCYRMNPLTQDIRRKVEAGEIGRIFNIHGSYLQDWLLYDTDYNWRVDTSVSGPSRAVADIGSHWLDLAQTLSGSLIVEVCAQTMIAHPVRHKSTHVIETFAKRAEDIEFESVQVETEDYAAALIRFANGSVGHFSCSEIAAGRKCFFNIELDGEKGSYYWNQEQSDHMWHGRRDEPSQLVMRDPLQMDPRARAYTQLAAGHPEGWNDAMKNNVWAFYQYILNDGFKRGVKPDFATFEDAHYIMRITDAILQSAAEKRWVAVTGA